MIVPIRAALILAGMLFWASAGSAEVFLVAPVETGLFGSSDPTPTFLWRGTEAKAVLVMIPGGDGHLGLTPERTDMGGFYGHALKRLSDPALTSGGLDVVVFDSPYRMLVGDSYPTTRTASDHLGRIESVISYYRDKLGKPIWLMGHSNGAVSVTEFWKDIRGGEKRDLIAGLVVSSARNGISLPDDTGIPVLFMHHAKDGCAKSNAQSSVAAYEALKAANTSRTEFVWIQDGESEPANPCYSGYHMYFGAGEQAAAAIDAFITRSFSPSTPPPPPSRGR